MSVFVDTNVFVYARDLRDPAKQARAMSWIEHLWSTKEGRTSTQVLNEYYVVLTRKLRPGMEPDQARADVERLLLWDPQPTDSFLIKQALEVGRISQLSHWDALIIAAAQRADCNSLLSEDLNDGQKFGTVKVINPFTNDPPAN